MARMERSHRRPTIVRSLQPMREIELQGGIVLHVAEAHHLRDEAGAVVWDAALCLVHFLQSAHVAGKRVIELGCGPGACGLVAAALGAAHVTLTDLPHLLPLVRSNIEANGLAATATAAELTWGAAVGHLQPPYDLVLASDVLYSAEALPLFVATLAQLCGPDTQVLLCSEHRSALPFPWALFKAAGFGVKQVPPEQQHPEWRSDDIQLFRIQLAAAR